MFLPSSPSSPLPARELDLGQRRSSSSLFDSLRNKRVEVDICTPSDTGRFAFHPLMTNSQAAVASLLPSFSLSSFTPLSSVNSCCNQQCQRSSSTSRTVSAHHLLCLLWQNGRLPRHLSTANVECVSPRPSSTVSLVFKTFRPCPIIPFFFSRTSSTCWVAIC